MLTLKQLILWFGFLTLPTPSKETDDKEMKNFIELLQVTVLELVRVSHDDSVYKSFKLTVYPED